MKEAIILILIIVFMIFVLRTIYRINTIRYLVVRAVWKVIDLISNRVADKAALPEGVVVESDLAYVKAGSYIQVLDVYYPEDKTDKLPVVIFTHGGGFIAGDKLQIRQFCMRLAKEGFLIFNINYGLAPKYNINEQLKDIFTAMSWVKENSESYKGDRNKIILAGDSAGAYFTAFASCISTNEKLADSLCIQPVFSENEIKGVALFSGIFDLATGSKTGFPSIKSDIEMLLDVDSIESFKAIDKFSVIKNITDKFPRAFISSGAVDWLHSESVQLAETLDKFGIYHKDMLFDKTEKKAMHDYQYHLELEPSKQCFKSVIEFLNEIA